jgi:hypothetical protein
LEEDVPLGTACGADFSSPGSTSFGTVHFEEAAVKLSIMLRVGITVLAATVTLLGAAGQEKKAPAPPKKAESAAPAVKLGSKDSAKWTDTTNAAAATPEQKAVLAGGKPMTVTGELVEVSCFLQLGKRGEKHIDCGSKCLQNGMPAAVVTSAGQIYLIIAEEHDPRRDGQADLRSVLIPLLSKQVSVTGMHTMHNGSHAIFVSASAVSAAK